MGTGTQSRGGKELPPDEERSRAMLTAQKVFVIKRLLLLADTGRCPEFVLLDTRAILSALRRRRCAVPKGQARLAQRFNAGFAAKGSRVPKGRLSERTVGWATFRCGAGRFGVRGQAKRDPALAHSRRGSGSAKRRRRCALPAHSKGPASRLSFRIVCNPDATPHPSAVPSGLGCLTGCFPALKRRAILNRSLRDKGTQRILFLTLEIRTTLHSRRRFEWSEARRR